ncbi:ubiquinone-dependent pyruvate dehydrogenase [Sinomonas sp. R1AF57]|uniref:ubiquinone-dependent pyruvate dehydrogenase n=1 Tax=Sinomonas TaxID=596707 RepID=UPI000B5FF3CA|nr:ubiquinone-dependent pyruvate dehydrogenase [Sinomonas sp. R1AF57]ASN51002.1 pyruvate oxidase [Sinomonas sp. R1AF57]
MTTIAENIVDTLAANGVRRVYGLPGDSLNGFTDALRGTPSIQWVHVRHEEAAAFAAAAEAALTGEVAVCAGSAGPGNLHLINGLYDANRSRVPVLAIAAHIPSTEIGSNYFQETHPTEVFRECSVYAEQVTDPAQMPRILEIALRTAVEKRGVAVVVLSGDIALAQVASDRIAVVRRAEPRVVPSGPELREAADILNAAGKVTILAGAGVEGAHDEVVALADALGAPIVHAFRGKEFIEYDNPFDVGMTGLLGFSSGYRAMESCDALLMLGTDFPYQQFYPERAKIIQVDIRGDQLGRRTRLDLGLVGDVKHTASALLPLLTRKKRRTHLESTLKHYAKTRSRLDDLATPTKKGQPLHPQHITRVLDQLADDDVVFTADVGTPVIWAARYLTMNGRRRLVGSFTHGSMANALPHAMGAQAAFPGRQVVALAGDGGLSMLMGELITLVQNRLPVKLVVFNNGSLNFIELEMKSAGFVNFGTGLDNPNFAAVAEALGIKGVRVNESSELERGLKEALAHDGPALVDVVTARQELAMPPAITAQQASGFTLYALRTVLSGRGDEVLDLAKTNWRQLF